MQFRRNGLLFGARFGQYGHELLSHRHWLRERLAVFDETAEQGDFSDKGSMETSGDARRINVLWYNVDGVSDDGTLFTVKVHVSPSAPSGSYPIEIAYSPENTLDADCDELELKRSRAASR